MITSGCLREIIIVFSIKILKIHFIYLSTSLTCMQLDPSTSKLKHQDCKVERLKLKVETTNYFSVLHIHLTCWLVQFHSFHGQLVIHIIHGP